VEWIEIILEHQLPAIMELSLFCEQ